MELDYSIDQSIPEEVFQKQFENIPSRSDLLGRLQTPEEMERDAALAAGKAEESGVEALDYEERSHYRYYLTRNLYKCNAKREPVKPIHARIADLLLLDLILFILNQDAYIYNESTGTFEPDRDGKRLKNKIRALLDYEFIEDKTINAIYNLIIGDARLTISDNQINNRPPHWIHFINGYYDRETGTLRNHDPKYREIGVIPWEYSPSRYPVNKKFGKIGSGLLQEMTEEALLFDKWIEEAIPAPEDRVMLLQYIAYSMSLETGAQKFLMVCGSGGTGKSTLLSVVEAILGRSNISSVSLQGLQDRFTPGELYLKQANICADIPITALSEVDMIKKLTGEDLISADRKFKNNFTFRSFARLYFSANDIPVNLSDKSNAFYRRMLILKMDRTPEKVDPALSRKLIAEIPHIITKAVEEWTLSNGAIVESDRSKALVKAAHKNSDTVEAFIDDRCELDKKARVLNTSLYAAYFNYCAAEERKPVTKSNFYKQLESKGFQRVRGKSGSDIVGLKLSNIIPLPTQSYA